MKLWQSLGNQINPANAFKYFTPVKIAEFTDAANAVLHLRKKSQPLFYKSINPGNESQLQNLYFVLRNQFRNENGVDASNVLNSMYKMDPAVESYTMLQIMVNEDLKRRCPITKF
jgi:hypothetical protein